METTLHSLSETTLIIEYAVQAWKPNLNRDIVRLEKVQRRATKIPYQLHSMEYADRLTYLGLTDLVTRRSRGDLIQVFKLLNGIEKMEDRCLPKCAPSRVTAGPASSTRGNSQKLQREKFPAVIKNNFGSAVALRHNYFSNRVVPLWNKLPDEVIRTPNLNIFKGKLDNFMSKTRVMSGAVTARYRRISCAGGNK